MQFPKWLQAWFGRPEESAPAKSAGGGIGSTETHATPLDDPHDSPGEPTLKIAGASPDAGYDSGGDTGGDTGGGGDFSGGGGDYGGGGSGGGWS